MRKSWWIIPFLFAAIGTPRDQADTYTGGLMNLRARFVFSIGLLGLVCCLLPGTLRAQTVYTYTGNAYDLADCLGAYCSGGPYAMSITFDTTLTGNALDDLTIGTVTGGNLTADISSFSFNDGILSINQGNAGSSEFDVTTNNSGNITAWQLTAACYPDCGPGYTDDNEEAYSYNLPPFGLNDVTDQGGVYSCNSVDCSALRNEGGLGANFGPAGTWTSTSMGAVTPEAPSYLLFGTGLLILAGLTYKRALA